MKRTKKSYGLFIAFAALLLGLACFGLFEVLGSSIAPDGRLQEPFALLPLGWTLITLGIVGLGASLIRRGLRKSETH
jgi:hypothetical protein